MTWQAADYRPYDDETALRLKQAFGQALLRHPFNPYAAAREIEPTESNGRAQWIVNNWSNDPVVVAAMGERVADLGAKAGLPTKDEFALALWQTDVKDPETKLRYLRTFAEVMGYIEKGGGININNNNQVINQPKIQRVPVFSSEKDWEARAKEIQGKLAAL